MRRSMLPAVLVAVFLIGIVIDIYCFGELSRKSYIAESLWTRNALIYILAISSIIGIGSLLSAVFIVVFRNR